MAKTYSLQRTETTIRLSGSRSDGYREAKILGTMKRDGVEVIVCDRRIHNAGMKICGWKAGGALVSEFSLVDTASDSSLPQ